MSSERVPELFPEEAAAAIKEINPHVRQAFLSKKLPSTSQRCYLNLTTLEKCTFCIEMTHSGFRVVGPLHDDITLANPDSRCYETIYALLNNISDGYKKSFGGELINKLLTLAKSTDGA